MRRALPLMLASVLVLGIAAGQDNGESKTTADRPPITPPIIDTDLIWNFHFEGKKRDGDFLELLTPEEGRNRTLVITQIAVRMRQSTRWQVVEHQPLREKGREGWKKVVRRSDLFSTGLTDSTTQFLTIDMGGLPGMKFAGGTRPALEFTSGSSDIAVYAEGYWSSK